MDTRTAASKRRDEATKLHNPLDRRALRRGQVRTGNVHCNRLRIEFRLPEIIADDVCIRGPHTHPPWPIVESITGHCIWSTD
jgi:hypothetical protein